jgi:hypothetical protein
MPVAHTCDLATQEAEIRRIEVQSQPRQTVLEILSQKYCLQKRASGGSQSAGPEFKPQYCKKKKKIIVMEQSVEIGMFSFFLCSRFCLL